MPANDFAPWSTPAVGDSFYLGHKQILWNLIRWTITTPMSGIVGVWEYYDGDFSKGNPTSVIDLGATLEFDLNGYLGTTKKEGTLIRVKLNDTGAFENVLSTWNGSQNLAVTGLLGQSTASTNIQDYTIGSNWESVPDLADATINLTVDEDVGYTLPQTLTRNWIAGDVNGNTAKWIRFRIVEVTTPISPVFQRARIELGDQYVVRSATQGRFQQDATLGSSTGLPDQSFQVTKPNYIDKTAVVDVDATEWTEVDDFLSSEATDEVYTTSLTDDDTAVITFGDGITGKVPPLGVGNIDVDYRHGANINGNAGAESITVDKTGITFVSSITNPRPAQGWSEADSASAESLEQAKVLGPTQLRIITTALGPSDVIAVTKSFQNAEGARPFSRAQGFEEGFGPKTLELVVVVKGGGQATQTQLDELSTYFNGDKYASPPVDSHYISNQQVTAVNFTPRLVDIEAKVTGSVTSEQVSNALQKVIHPEALKSDGVSYEWEFGGKIPRSRLSHEIFKTDSSITEVVLTTPAGDLQLTKRELPVLGTVNITVA